MPGFEGAGEEGQELFFGVERSFRGGFVAVEADGSPGIGGQAVAVRTDLTGGADFPAEGGGGCAREVEGFRGCDVRKLKPMGGGKAGDFRHVGA